MKKVKYLQVIVHCNDFEKKIKYIENTGLGRIKYKLPMINACVVEIKEDKLQNIKDIDGIISVELDTHITAQMNRVSNKIESQWAHKRNITGKGIGVAVVDTGISLHKDFIEGGNRVVAFKDLIHGGMKAYDDNGHGTHVAGIIGGNGYSSQKKYIGLAPECNLIILKVLDHKGDGNISDVLAGLQWIINNKKKYNIRVLNISVGTGDKKNLDEDSLLVQGVNAVWDSGIIVVVAAGNNGPGPMSISTPGISRKIITVGSSDDNMAVEILNNARTKDYSGRGPTPYCIKKPDIVAPGSSIISCNANRSSVESKNGRYQHAIGDSPMMYTIKSGTSMATPVVAGALALLVSAYPNMTNKDVKLRLRDRAVDLGQHWGKQGWGLLNVRRLLEE